MKIYITKIEKEKAWEIRHKVMWPDKPFDFIQLDNDDTGIHLGLFKNNKLTSVISLFIKNGECQFRKFATIQREQGNGHGSALLSYVLEEAKHFGIKKIWCNARKDKVAFYKKFGLQETEKHFLKEGKAYVIMEEYV
ncbi:GNAT family N-acetyltransferase [Oceanobacillus profundus]|uniref:GNAT family N-acetyltransferase n=1 Tax=Oceanobacillus TaxID=182709 RepID=UPI0026E2DFC7|nr:GNAT family N-acetyltransferase [Oceanobacillus profundus]MDO6447692.1 GNAT family N-acetyltransferase [Oceanobacillus profundus]